MAIVLPKQQSTGEMLASSLGTGLQALAQKKMQEVSQRNGLMALGYPEEQASKLSQLDPSFLQAIVKQNLASQSKFGKAGLGALAGLGRQEEIPSNIEELRAESPSEFPPQPIPSEQAQEQPQVLFPMFPSQAISAAQTGLPTEQLIALERPKEINPEAPKAVPKEEKPIKQQVKEIEKLSPTNEFEDAEKELKQLLKQTDDVKEKRMIHAEINKLKDKKDKAFKATKEYRAEVSKQEKAAGESDFNITQLQKLNEEGRLPNALFYSGLKGLGLDIPILKGAQGELYEKIIASYQRFAKDMFGGRVTNYEMTQFLNMLPTLSNTQDGRRLILENMRVLNQMSHLTFETMNQISKEHGGIPPYDIQEQTLTKLRPQINQLAEQFKSNLDKGSFKPGQLFDELPNAGTLPEGSKVRDKNTGKIMQVKNGKWKVV